MAADYLKARRWMAKEQRALGEYILAQQQRGMVAFNLAHLRSYVEGSAPIGYATAALQYLGGYSAAQGCDAVFRGNSSSGSKAIDLACTHRFWQVAILARAYELDTRPDKQPRIDMWDLATAWLHACALGVPAVMERLLPLLQRVCEGEEIIGGRDMSPTGTLVAHWATGIEVARLERQGWKKIGPYASLVAGAPDPDDIDKLCDEHIRQVNIEGDDTFAQYPYRVIPFELLAAARRLNLTFSGARHPLLASPLAQPRTVPSLPYSDELAAVLQRAKTELGLELP